jgi:hypothetical protein
MEEKIEILERLRATPLAAPAPMWNTDAPMWDTDASERFRMDQQRLRAVREAAAQAGFCIAICCEDGACWTARAYCLGNDHEDLVERAETENAAAEAVATRLRLFPRT